MVQLSAGALRFQVSVAKTSAAAAAILQLPLLSHP